MDQNTERNEFEMKHCFIALKKSWVKMVVAALILAILGGAFALFNRSYSTNLIFRVTGGSTTHSLLYYLQSEAFAEKLMGDENGLPPRDLCDAETYDSATSLLKDVEALEERKIELNKEMTIHSVNKRTYTLEYERLVSKYNEVESLLRAYLSEYSDYIANSEQHQATIRQYQEKLEVLRAEKDAYKKDVYDPIVDEELALEMEYDLLNRELKEKRKDLTVALDDTARRWRENIEVQEQVAKVMKGVKFEYSQYDSLLAEEEAVVSGDQESAAAASKHYISVTITSKDKEFVETVTAKLKDTLGGHVETFVKRDSGALDPRCQLTTPYAPINQNSNLVVFAAIGAAAGIVIVGFGAIIKEMLIFNGLVETKEKKAKKSK